MKETIEFQRIRHSNCNLRAKEESSWVCLKFTLSQDIYIISSNPSYPGVLSIPHHKFAPNE